MEPHIKLLVLDLINYSLGLMGEWDRRSLIHDLYEQQVVIDAKTWEDHERNLRQQNGLADSEHSLIVQKYMRKQDDLEFRTLTDLNR